MEVLLSHFNSMLSIWNGLNPQKEGLKKGKRLFEKGGSIFAKIKEHKNPIGEEKEKREIRIWKSKKLWE